MNTEKARKLRKVLDRTMIGVIILLGVVILGFFGVSVVNLTISLWTMGLGLVPVVLVLLIAFILTWHHLDGKVNDVLEGEETDE